MPRDRLRNRIGLALASCDGIGIRVPTKIVFPLARKRSSVCCQNVSVAGVQVGTTVSGKINTFAPVLNAFS